MRGKASTSAGALLAVVLCGVTIQSDASIRSDVGTPKDPVSTSIAEDPLWAAPVLDLSSIGETGDYLFGIPAWPAKRADADPLFDRSAAFGLPSQSSEPADKEGAPAIALKNDGKRKEVSPPERSASREVSEHERVTVPDDAAPRFNEVPPAVSVDRIRFTHAALAPLAHTRFCMQYRQDCRPSKIVFRGGALTLTPQRRAELAKVNAAVNRAIRPERNTAGVLAERWLVSPTSGECHDYAVTKRHELLARGWPAHALLLAEVVTSWGEHHLVLIVRTREGDLVADSLTSKILPWSKAPYRWVRVQTPANPAFWAAIAQPVAMAALERKRAVQ